MYILYDFLVILDFIISQAYNTDKEHQQRRFLQKIFWDRDLPQYVSLEDFSCVIVWKSFLS